MGTQIVAKKTAIDAMAARLQVSPQQLQKTLQSTAFKECRTNEEFISAVIVANTYQLNPLLGEIFAFPMKGGGVKPIVSVDGFIHLINAQKDHDGIELVENRNEKGDKNVSKTDVESITAKIYTKGRAHPTIVTEYMAECYDGSKGPWQKWPIRMLRHKALIQCARVAYGFTGIVDQDEVDRMVSNMEEAPEILMPQQKHTVAEKTGATQDRPEGLTPEPPVSGGGLSQEEKDEAVREESRISQQQLDERKVAKKYKREPGQEG